MKKALRIVGLLLGVLGCLAALGMVLQKRQQAKRQRQQIAGDDLLLPSKSQQLMQVADTLTRRQRDTLFQRHDIARLFQLSKSYPMVQNGFLGSTPQRLEVVFKQVVPQANRPGLYLAEGLMRSKGKINTLAGAIQLRQVRYLFEGTPGTYIATGTFRLAQRTPGSSTVVTLQGLVAIDFEVVGGKVSLFAAEGAMRPVSREFAFEGTLSGAQFGQPQRVLWAAEFGPLATTILEDFGVGGRSEEVNPKYRKYGWDNYYQNEEWWAATPR